MTNDHRKEVRTLPSDRNSTGPSFRYLGIAGGTAMLLGAWWRRGLGSALLALFGMGLLCRSLATPHSRARQKRIRWEHDHAHLEGTVSINRPAQEVYNFWRELVQLPKIMGFIDYIEPKGGDVTHWVAHGPDNRVVEWDAELIDDLPNHRLTWETLPGSDVHGWGTVTFESDPQRTVVVLAMNFEPSERHPEYATRQFLNNLKTFDISNSLRELKIFLETGNAVPPGDRGPRLPLEHETRQ